MNPRPRKGSIKKASLSSLDSSFSEDDDTSSNGSAVSEPPRFPGSPSENKDGFCVVCGEKLRALRGTRRHHCRRCGSAVCKEHSMHRIVIERIEKPQRLCDNCFRVDATHEMKFDFQRRISLMKETISSYTHENDSLSTSLSDLTAAIPGKRAFLENLKIHCKSSLKSMEDRVTSEKATCRAKQATLQAFQLTFNTEKETRDMTATRLMNLQSEYNDEEFRYKSDLLEVQSKEKEIKTTTKTLESMIPKKVYDQFSCPHVPKPAVPVLAAPSVNRSKSISKSHRISHDSLEQKSCKFKCWLM